MRNYFLYSMLFYSLFTLILVCHQVNSFKSHQKPSLPQVFFGDQVLLLDCAVGKSSGREFSVYTRDCGLASWMSHLEQSS